jgi:ABC-type phosphate/phosphonate transport system ATPase subunit
MRVEIHNLVVDFPQRSIRALDGIDLTIEKGGQVALLGPSGSGKTTLLRTIVGAVKPSRGIVTVDGIDPNDSVAGQRRIQRNTGMVRQRDDLVSGLKARTNALLGTSPAWSVSDWLRVLSGHVPSRYQSPLETLAASHGVARHLDARIEHLSGGQRQRVALIRALLPDGELLLADEPTSGLDPVTGLAAVRALQDVEGATLIVSTHDVALTWRFPRVIALRDGRVSYDGPPPDDAQVASIYEPSEVKA